jgi:hypothetical protein
MDDPACLCTFKEQQSMCYIKEQAKFNAEQIQQTRLQTKQICTFITTTFWYAYPAQCNRYVRYTPTSW